MSQRRCLICHRVIEDWQNGHCFNCDGYVGTLPRKRNRKTRTAGGGLQSVPFKSPHKKKSNYKYPRSIKSTSKPVRIISKPSLISCFQKFLGEVYGKPTKCGSILKQYGFSGKRLLELAKYDKWVKNYYENIIVELFNKLCRLFPAHSVKVLFIKKNLVGKNLHIITSLHENTIAKLASTPIDEKLMQYLKSPHGNELIEGIIVDTAKRVR